MNDDTNSLPGPTGWDHAHLAVKVALAALPIAGGPAAELFAAVIAPPLARRRDEWLQSLAEGLAALEGKVEGFKVEALDQKEEFISAAMQASLRRTREGHRVAGFPSESPWWALT